MTDWARKNKLIVFLTLVVVYFAWGRYRYHLPQPLRLSKTYDESIAVGMPEPDFAMGAPGMISNSLIPPGDGYYEPVSTSTERLVIQNSNMSLLVDDVRETGDKIIDFAKSKGGFMVDASYNRPESEAFGTISVRVPTNSLDETLNFYRGLSVKVTNEYIQGRDVTEQYTNIEDRLATLEKTKAKFEQILDSATKIQDILQVQREITNLQRQIDSLIGQKEAIENNAALTKITVFLSSDELSLPYTPDDKFRPNVIFKLAVRSMLGSMQSLGEFVIWAAVYSIIWIPAIVLFALGKRYWKRKFNKAP